MKMEGYLKSDVMVMDVGKHPKALLHLNTTTGHEQTTMGCIRAYIVISALGTTTPTTGPTTSTLRMLAKS